MDAEFSDNSLMKDAHVVSRSPTSVLEYNFIRVSSILVPNKLGIREEGGFVCESAVRHRS
eukprot:2756676-Pleurochrysis_carterae.AAC.1